MARPLKYSSQLVDKICERISNSSDGLVKICEPKEFPHHATVLRWLTEDDKHEFRDKYARAKEAQADYLADEIIAIADAELQTREETECLTKDGAYTTTTLRDNHNRSRLMIDARKWKASKLAPKKYGDKLDLSGATVAYTATVTAEEAKEIAKALDDKY